MKLIVDPTPRAFAVMLHLFVGTGVKKALVFSASAIVVFFLTSGVSAQNKFPAFVRQPQLWEKVNVAAPEECNGTERVCARRFLDTAKVDLGAKPAYSVYRLGEIDGRSLTIVIVTVKVNDDDSVSSIRYRLAISLGDVEDRTFKLETLGRQFTCFRGHKYWSKALCP